MFQTKRPKTQEKNVFGLKQTIGAPVEIRTPDPWLRRPILYPLSYRRFPITVIHYTPFFRLSRFSISHGVACNLFRREGDTPKVWRASGFSKTTTRAAKIVYEVEHERIPVSLKRPQSVPSLLSCRRLFGRRLCLVTSLRIGETWRFPTRSKVSGTKTFRVVMI